MVDHVFEVVVLVVAGSLLSIGLESIGKPPCKPHRRSLWSWLFHTGAFFFVTGVVLAVVRRPGMAVAGVLAAQILLVVVNNAKFKTLREPFLFVDFGMLNQAIAHPRLYWPFLGTWRIVVVSAAFVSAVVCGLLIEASSPLWVFIVLGLLAAGAVFFIFGFMLAPEPNAEPAGWIPRQGLFVTAAYYWLYEKFSPFQAPVAAYRVHIPTSLVPARDVVLVQSESFFDVRRLWGGVLADVLEHYDRVSGASGWSGRLSVPTWGANTMRTEFGILSGLSPECMGIDRYHPYRRLAARVRGTLPEVFQAAGYKTICVHPYPADFFRRDKVFPAIGFSEFRDIESFRDARKCGAYVADAEVTKQVKEILSQEKGPVFIFVITMENHGPFHLEKVRPPCEGVLTSGKLPTGCDDLAVYLSHLKNADHMLGELSDFLVERGRPYVFSFYGEHVPALCRAYSRIGFPDGTTNYLMQSDINLPAMSRNLHAHEIGGALLELVLMADKSNHPAQSTQLIN